MKKKKKPLSKTGTVIPPSGEAAAGPAGSGLAKTNSGTGPSAEEAKAGPGGEPGSSSSSSSSSAAPGSLADTAAIPPLVPTMFESSLQSNTPGSNVFMKNAYPALQSSPPFINPRIVYTSPQGGVVYVAGVNYLYWPKPVSNVPFMAVGCVDVVQERVRGKEDIMRSSLCHHKFVSPDRCTDVPFPPGARPSDMLPFFEIPCVSGAEYRRWS